MNGFQYIIITNQTPQQLLPPNPRRTYLLIGGSGVHTSYFSLGGKPSIQQGCVLGTILTMFALRRADIGELITQALWWSGTVGDTLTVIEGFE